MYIGDLIYLIFIIEWTRHLYEYEILSLDTNSEADVEAIVF